MLYCSDIAVEARTTTQLERNLDTTYMESDSSEADAYPLSDGDEDPGITWAIVLGASMSQQSS